MTEMLVQTHVVDSLKGFLLWGQNEYYSSCYVYCIAVHSVSAFAPPHIEFQSIQHGNVLFVQEDVEFVRCRYLASQFICGSLPLLMEENL